MARVKKRLQNLTIRKRIILYTYSIIIPILLLIYMGITAYEYTNRREEYVDQQKSDISSLASSLNFMEADIRNLSLNLVISQEIQNVLDSDSPETLNQDPQLWQHSTPVAVYEDIVALKGYIRTMSIYPENGVMPYLRCIDSSSAYIPELEIVKETSTYQRAAKLRGKGIWVTADKGRSDIYQANRSEKLVLCRAIYNQSKDALLGYLTIGISQDRIEELCRSVLGSSKDGILLMDRDGNEIVSYGNIEEEVRQYLAQGKLSAAADCHGVYGGWELFTGPDSDSGWQVYKVLPKKGFWAFLNEIVYVPLLLMLGLAIGLWPVLRAMSHRISKPLQDVCEAMVLFRKGDFEQQVEIQTNDEVGQVAACFNHMVTDIRDLINRNYIMVLKERESELAILQAQINPHFLYNALDSIYWQATNEGDEATADSIYELSQLFRIVLGQGKSLVTVEMELELLYRYLEIQKLRFREQLDYRLDVDQTIMGEKIPKLILQPFVENAVIHGMQNDAVDFLVIVTAKPLGDYLEFCIHDNGIGMDELQLRRIWEEDNDKVFSGQRIGRYAIKNVKERLELEYGDDFKLAIKSQPGEGTLVRLQIPLMEEKKDGIEIVDS